MVLEKFNYLKKFNNLESLKLKFVDCSFHIGEFDQLLKIKQEDNFCPKLKQMDLIFYECAINFKPIELYVYDEEFNPGEREKTQEIYNQKLNQNSVDQISLLDQRAKITNFEYPNDFMLSLKGEIGDFLNLAQNCENLNITFQYILFLKENLNSILYFFNEICAQINSIQSLKNLYFDFSNISYIHNERNDFENASFNDLQENLQLQNSNNNNFLNELDNSYTEEEFSENSEDEEFSQEQEEEENLSQKENQKQNDEIQLQQQQKNQDNQKEQQSENNQNNYCDEEEEEEDEEDEEDDEDEDDQEEDDEDEENYSDNDQISQNMEVENEGDNLQEQQQPGNDKQTQFEKNLTQFLPDESDDSDFTPQLY
ncbi:hypothetical protein PPERSA_12840 [Pseudocohnilembus persalinus]|uniref:Uncharacterized protein n=1 Tax=Pseudocohnilembus persalinus TaxID=266149 RepID=A0A0V0QV72_PSEPJ|nr:hypothetical protein PPERSA_12840 [Pseudocohnilembus persalinus]|eukprot:KRX06151.1 hypothetical protein PPERSA_12840 [Pseudocohnilembus persalinus]